MPEEDKSPSAPQNIMELFPRSFGALGAIASWLLIYFLIIMPWDEALRQSSLVVFSIKGIAISLFCTLWSLALVIGGKEGSRLITDLAPSRFRWKQGVFIVVWIGLSIVVYVILEDHLRRSGYAV